MAVIVTAQLEAAAGEIWQMMSCICSGGWPDNLSLDGHFNLCLGSAESLDG